MIQIILYQLLKFLISHIIGSISVTFYMAFTDNQIFNKNIAYVIYFLSVVPVYIIQYKYI